MIPAKRIRLDRMPANARAIGVERVCALVHDPTDKSLRSQGDAHLIAASILARRHLAVTRERGGVAPATAYTRVWF
jgi:hypothetical protein